MTRPFERFRGAHEFPLVVAGAVLEYWGHAGRFDDARTMLLLRVIARLAGVRVLRPPQGGVDFREDDWARLARAYARVARLGALANIGSLAPTNTLSPPALRQVRVAALIFRALEAFLPKRIAREEFGDALEDLARRVRSWPRAVAYIARVGAVAMISGLRRLPGPPQ